MIALRLLYVVLLLALLAFGAGVMGSFHFDDYSLFADPAVASSEGGLRVWDISRTRPLTYFSFWLNFVLGGRDPVAYHVVNLILHLVCVWLLFDVLKRLMPEQAALIAAGIFGVHPIQAEAVNYVFARSSVLMTLFCLLSIRDWVMGHRWRAVVWFGVALLAKEECVALPFFFLLLYLSISRNVAELKPIWAMFGLAVIFGIRTLFAVSVTPGANVGTQLDMQPLEYLGTQGVAILRYFRLLVVPYGLTVDPDLPRTTNWLAWVGVAGLAAIALKWFTKARPGFWFLSGLVLLLPSSSILAAADLAADRRMYLPMIAFAAMAGLLLSRLPKFVSVFLCVGLATLSYGRTEVWNSETSLWSDAVRKAPDKARPKIQLARVSSSRAAYELLQQARRLAPNDPQIAAELGRVYLDEARPDLALAEFGRQLALTPNDPRAITNRAIALWLMKQEEAARQDLQRALEQGPCVYEARVNAQRLGVALPKANCRFTDEQIAALKGDK